MMPNFATVWSAVTTSPWRIRMYSYRMIPAIPATASVASIAPSTFAALPLRTVSPLAAKLRGRPEAPH